jgi:hypothetical protein
MNTDGTYLSGVLPTGSNAKANYPTWNSGNTAWSATDGRNSTGGMVVTMQTIGAEIIGFLTIGNSTKHAVKYSVSDDGIYYVLIGFDNSHDGSQFDSVSLGFEALVYDLNGNFVKTLGEDSGGGVFGLPVWNQSGTGKFNLTAESDIPQSGYIDFIARYHDPTPPQQATEIYSDNIIIEAYVGTSSIGTYFDGDTSGASWMGTPRDSASYFGDGLILLGILRLMIWL